jgi:hypothetical protein
MAYKIGTATDYLDLLDKLYTFALAVKADAVAIAGGGAGYTAADVLTVSGGTAETAAQIHVDTVDGGGAITGAHVGTAGLYCLGSTPANAVSVTGGTGAGATFNITWAGALGWTHKRRSRQAVSATVGAGGAGYVVGDLISLSGGVVTGAAMFRVETVAGGAVATVSVWKAGNYPEVPANAVATTGGTGTGATLNVTWGPVVATSGHSGITAATIQTAGTGYTPGDVVTVSGCTGTAPTVKILTAPAGVPATIQMVTRGDCTVTPSNPASVTGGSGTGLRLTLTWEILQAYPNREMILMGDGGGPFQIYVGARTYDDAGGTGAYQWELAGFTGYTAASTFINQPGISPGRYNAADEGSYVALRNGSISYWFFVSNRRLLMIAKCGATYSQMYLGFINPFATSTEYPYPLAVIGSTATWNKLYSSGALSHSGLLDPYGTPSCVRGPFQLRAPDGTWRSIFNAGDNGTEKTAAVVFPCGKLSTAGWPAEDSGTLANICFSSFCPRTSTTPTYKLLPAPGEVLVLIPNFIVCGPTDANVFGEIDAVYYVSGYLSAGTVAAEDTITTAGGDVYIIFSPGNRADSYAMFAVKRE